MRTLDRMSPVHDSVLFDRPILTINTNNLLLTLVANAICNTGKHVADWAPWAHPGIAFPYRFGHMYRDNVARAAKVRLSP